jgi:hypothetical protein
MSLINLMKNKYNYAATLSFGNKLSYAATVPRDVIMHINHHYSILADKGRYVWMCLCMYGLLSVIINY